MISKKDKSGLGQGLNKTNFVSRKRVTGCMYFLSVIIVTYLKFFPRLLSIIKYYSLGKFNYIRFYIEKGWMGFNFVELSIK